MQLVQRCYLPFLGISFWFLRLSHTSFFLRFFFKFFLIFFSFRIFPLKFWFFFLLTMCEELCVYISYRIGMDGGHSKTNTKTKISENKTELIDSIKSPIHSVPFVCSNGIDRRTTHWAICMKKLMIQRIKRHFNGVHESNNLQLFRYSFMFYCYLRFMIADSSFEWNTIFLQSIYDVDVLHHHDIESIRNNLCRDHRFCFRLKVLSWFLFSFCCFLWSEWQPFVSQQYFTFAWRRRTQFVVVMTQIARKLKSSELDNP